MKKILIATLCATALTLTACDKKSTDTAAATPAVQLSTNNTADIKADLAAIETLGTAKAKEALEFQNKIMQAAQTGGVEAVKETMTSMEKFTQDFNKDLDALTIKSTEVDSIRNKMKASNDTSLEMIKMTTSGKPDQNKIMELQKKATTIQQELITETQALKQKLGS
ncbi:hypothetical protein RFH42_15770 [Acinetobacter rudis]|uniref:hypothetical protein n=1 Tax=Acinetobacter rudis TaxID=632955 RepID=UPI00280E9635|nr:hypothetical protein [Acinetobacter rudis]MDQ8954407.1 hypothetical protein [Acinetobacter rudis]